MGPPALARRFSLKPLNPPPYKIHNVPYYNKNRPQDSKVYYTSDREYLQECMAEMLLLCNEAVRRVNDKNHNSNNDNSDRCDRNEDKENNGDNANDNDNNADETETQRRHCSNTSKPLCLEYMADRLDVDDPIHAFLVRTADSGQLQGFVTFTTFTNWQQGFMWDSTHPRCFEGYVKKDVAVDEDGSLSKALQACVRCGDVYNEGVVYPRIAEISLLGALGCGKMLVELAIEYIEGLSSSTQGMFKFCALQATDNSIPFYEKMGFVRVGAVTDEQQDSGVGGKASKSDNDSVQSVQEPKIVSSPVFTWHTNRHIMTLKEVASFHKVDVWDLIFLNHYLYPGLVPSSRLKKNTEVFVPKNEDRGEHDMDKVAYMHWNFPDEPVHEPSYMMAQKLNRTRKPSKGKKWGPIASSQPTPIEIIVSKPPENAKEVETISATVTKSPKINSENLEEASTKSKKRKILHPEQPHPPKKPLTPFLVFAREERKRLGDSVPKPITEATKLFSSIWRGMSVKDKQPYEAAYAKSKLVHIKEQAAYEVALKEFYEKHPLLRPVSPDSQKLAEKKIKKIKREKKPPKLFNRVVQLDPNDTPYGTTYKYYYVLTYLPDLQWCQLVPMTTRGKFPDSGRDKFVLIHENECKELDVSAKACKLVRNARAMRRTQDADKEEWDISDKVVDKKDTSKGFSEERTSASELRSN